MNEQKIRSNVTTANDFKSYTGDTPDWRYSPSTTQPNPEGPYTIPNQPIPDYGGLNYGWICPKCGSVFSPNTRECPYCNGHTNTITYSTSATIDISQTNNNNTNTTAEFKTPDNITSGKLNS